MPRQEVRERVSDHEAQQGGDADEHERVHERAAKVARRERGRHREFCPGEPARAVEDPVLHPVAEVEERLEVLAAHRGEPTPSLRAR